MKRVLQVYPVLNNAGTEMVMMNWYRELVKYGIQFDFLVQGKGALDEEILRMGGKIYYLSNDNRKKYYRDLISFFSNHPEYKIVHTHTHKEMGDVLRAAKKMNIQCRIAHSHNARTDIGSIGSFIKKFKSIPIKRNATHYFACSLDAGRWLFPYKNINIEIIHNGIDVDKFTFNNECRDRMREQLKIKNSERVICHVGRFAEEKNHEYLIDIFKNIVDIDSNVKLILVGEGPLLDKIKQKVKELDICNNVLFLGNRTDVNQILNVSDLFLFPSKHEGLGIVLIEAQVNGLPCIVSNNIPNEADMNINLFYRCSLDDELSKWKNIVFEHLILNRNRIVDLGVIEKKGYNICKESLKLYQWYMKQMGDS